MGAKLPLAARVAAGGGRGVLNPKIWAKHVMRLRGGPFAAPPWLAAAREAMRQRRWGDVLCPIRDRVCEILAWAGREKGLTQVPFAFLAVRVGCCVETARKAVRWLESAGLVDTFNVIARFDHAVLRPA